MRAGLGTDNQPWRCRALLAGASMGALLLHGCDGTDRVFVRRVPSLAASADAGSLALRPAACGDSIVGAGEDCEPPGTPTCDNDCRSASRSVCGNGLVDNSEECEDANTANGDGCSASCRVEFCGNGRIDFGEACEPPGTGS